MGGCCTRNFGCTKSNWLFHDIESWRFYSAQYTGSRVWNIIYVVWRWLTTAFFFTILLLSLIRPVPPYSAKYNQKYYLIYLTNWTYLAFVTSTILRAILSSIGLCNKKVLITSKYLYGTDSDDNDNVNKTSHRYRTTQAFLTINWILYEIIAVGNIMITLMYWLLVYDSEVSVLELQTTIVHGVNAAFVLADIWITAMPVRLLHFWIPMSFAFLYAIFIPIYISSGGVNDYGDNYIYKAIDWAEGNAGTSVAGSIILIIAAGILHVIIFGIYRLKVWLYERIIEKCCGGRAEEQTTKMADVEKNEGVTKDENPALAESAE